MKQSLALATLLALFTVATPAWGQAVEELDDERMQADSPERPDGPVQLSRVEELVVERTNAFRRERERERLRVSPDLTQAAQYFAQYMARTERYGHMADRNRPAGRAEEYGYDYCIVAENIAYQYSSLGFEQRELARRLVQGWIDSPRHRENMLDRDLTEIGVGVAQSEETGNWYAVQMFGRPRSAIVTFSVSNRAGETVRYAIDGRSFPLRARYTRRHRRCRPASIDFAWTEKDEALEPTPGAHYVVGEGQAGQLTVSRRGAD